MVMDYQRTVLNVDSFTTTKGATVKVGALVYLAGSASGIPTHVVKEIFDDVGASVVLVRLYDKRESIFKQTDVEAS